MADPRDELADIIVPAAPDVASGARGLPLWVLAAALVGVACVGLAIWLWQWRRPKRTLNAIARAVALRQGSTSELAGRLDAWARARFRLQRLDASSCPPGLDAAAWFAWVNTLVKLRYAPPQADGRDALAALCETARQWGRHA